MADVKDFMAGDIFAKNLGIMLLEAANGHARAQMEIREEHFNAVNIAQGGVIFTLADLTLAAAANSHGRVAVSVNCNISFIKPALKGIIYAEAVEISRSQRLANYDVSVTNEKAELLAKMGGTVYIKNEAAQ